MKMNMLDENLYSQRFGVC